MSGMYLKGPRQGGKRGRKRFFRPKRKAPASSAPATEPEPAEAPLAPAWAFPGPLEPLGDHPHPAAASAALTRHEPLPAPASARRLSNEVLGGLAWTPFVCAAWLVYGAPAIIAYPWVAVVTAGAFALGPASVFALWRRARALRTRAAGLDAWASATLPEDHDLWAGAHALLEQTKGFLRPSRLTALEARLDYLLSQAKAALRAEATSSRPRLPSASAAEPLR